MGRFGLCNVFVMYWCVWGCVREMLLVSWEDKRLKKLPKIIKLELLVSTIMNIQIYYIQLNVVQT